MARLAAVTNAEDRANDGADGGRGLGRALLAVLGIAAVGYLVARWRRGETSLEDVQERITDEAGAALEDAEPISIGEPGEEEETGDESDDEGADEPGDEEADEPDNEGADALDAVSTTDRTEEEITERVESDMQEEPAEPGAMSIDEDVADEVVDEDGSDEG